MDTAVEKADAECTGVLDNEQVCMLCTWCAIVRKALRIAASELEDATKTLEACGEV